MSRALTIATNLKLDEKILISLIINGLQDDIRRQVLLKEPKSLPELSKFLKLCEVINAMSVNTLETKFESLVGEIKELKSELRTNSVSAMQTEPPFRNFASDIDFGGNRPTPFMGRRNFYRSPPNQYQEYAYRKPKVFGKSTSSSQVNVL